MKILFDFDFANNKHMNIPCNLPINILDRLDGLTDTISFEFMYDADLMLEYHKHQKAVLKVYKEIDDTTPFREYRMVISDLSRDTNTMYMKNNAPLYTYTCTITEPTVLIDENIRTDIAITPYLYPKDNSPYKTLYDAYNKILSSHNLNSRNEKVYKAIVKTTNTTNLPNEYVKFTGSLYIQSFETPSFNETIYFENESLPISGETYLKDEVQYNIYVDNGELKCDVYGDVNEYNLEITSIDYISDDKVKNILSKVPCPSLTYIDLSTYGQLSDIFDRVGAVPYLDYDNEGKCYVTFYLKQGAYENEIKTLSNMSTEEVAKPSDMYSNTISSQIKNMVCDDELIIYPTLFSDAILKDYDNSKKEEHEEDEDWEFAKTISVSLDKSMSQIEAPYDYVKSGIGEGVYFGVDILVPNGFDSASEAIGEANSYYIQLPTNIEYIKRIYVVKRDSAEGGRSFKLTPIANDRIVEYSEFNATQDSQKHYFAYFVRGENRINQVCSLLSSIGELDQDFKWDAPALFNNLRKCRFVVVYKPMMDTNYTSYSYKDLKSTTTKYVDLPYKIVSDKQASNLLSFELEKYNSNKILFNQVGLNVEELKHYAGERVFYSNKRFLESYNVGNFASYEELVNTYNTNTVNVDSNLWATVNNIIYVIDVNSNKWVKYRGKQCVITKINFTIYNNTISASYELSDKIAFNSSVSGYSDNVRVSDNLSSENVVNRNIQLYKTVLLNACTSDFTSYAPSLVSSNSTPYLKDLDSFILPNALNQQGFCKYLNTTSASHKDVKLKDLNKIAFNIKTDAFIDTTVWDINSWYDYSTISTTPALQTQTFSNVTEFVEYLTDTYGYNRAYYPTFVYDSTNNTYEATKIFRIKNDLLIPDRMFEIPNDFKEDGLYQYRYVWDESDTGHQLINFQFRQKETSLWNTIYTYDISNLSYPVVLRIGNVSQNSQKTESPKFASQYNTIWQNSNTISNVSMYNQDPAVIGFYADGSNGGDTFYKTIPLFYNRSDSNDYIYNIGNYNVTLYPFSKLLEGTGFEDLNIDLRELVSCNIQYIIIPNNSTDFMINHYVNEFKDLYNITTPFSPFYRDTSFIDIKELNNNLQWFSNSQNITLDDNVVNIYKVIKGTTMNDYLGNKTLGTLVTTGVSNVEINQLTTNDGTLISPSIKIQLNDTINSDSDYDFIIENNSGTPLLLFSNEGCQSTNSIILSTFII